MSALPVLRPRRPRGAAAALGRLARGLVTLLLLPLALPLAVPFLALSTRDARGRVLRAHLP